MYLSDSKIIIENPVNMHSEMWKKITHLIWVPRCSSVSKLSAPFPDFAWTHIHIPSVYHSFFGRFDDALICFQDLGTFRPGSVILVDK